MEEIWKEIEDLDGFYEVSNFGRIRNKKTLHIKSIIFDGHYCKFGYDYTIQKVRKRGWYRIHKAVAKTFILNPENKPTVNHKDGNKKNNRVDNLEWATHKEQTEHRVNILNRCCGENNYNAQYTNEQVREMRRLYEKENFDIQILQNMFGGRKKKYNAYS